MNNIKNKIDDLFDDLEKTDKYKKYVKIKKQLENDKEIMDLIDLIKRHQKVLANNKDIDVENKLKELYLKLESYPIYQSYLIKKEELETDLFMIKETFSKYFEEILKLQ